MKQLSKSLSDTAKIAKNLAKQYQGRGGVITLQGQLGAGKTTFTQSFAKALGIHERITSPTFTLAKQYQIPGSNIILHHLDLYRVDNSTDLRSLSLDELLSEPNNLVIIEWPEKITSTELNPSTRIFINILNSTKRDVIIESEI